MPEKVILPTRVKSAKYNLFRHEYYELDTRLPKIKISSNGDISFEEVQD